MNGGPATVSERKLLPKKLERIIKAHQTTYEKVHTVYNCAFRGWQRYSRALNLKVLRGCLLDHNVKGDKFPALRVSNTLNGIIKEFKNSRFFWFWLTSATVSITWMRMDPIFQTYVRERKSVIAIEQADDPATYPYLDVDCCYAGAAVRGGTRTWQLHAEKRYYVYTAYCPSSSSIRASTQVGETICTIIVEELFEEIRRKSLLRPQMRRSWTKLLETKDLLLCLSKATLLSRYIISHSFLVSDPTAHPRNVLVELTVAGCRDIVIRLSLSFENWLPISPSVPCYYWPT
jgi:hypothetical protein